MNPYKIALSKEAGETIANYKKSNLPAYKKTLKLIDELKEHPRTGTGHPEPLVGGNNITYSRTINKKDRLVYDIYDDIVTVLVISAKGHYKDK